MVFKGIPPPQEPIAWFCTADYCNTKFVDRHDWTIHEHNNHMQFDSWRCEQPAIDGPSTTPQRSSCDAILYRRETFRDHLSAVHGITEMSEVEKLWETSIFGHNSHRSRSFWCGGPCQRIVDIPVKELHAEAAAAAALTGKWQPSLFTSPPGADEAVKRFRTKHIGDHIEFDGLVQANWVSMVKTVKKRTQLTEPTEPTNVPNIPDTSTN